MALEFILLGIGIVGFGIAGYLDLKTTEFPDWLPYSIIITSVAVRGVFSLLVNDFSFLIDSVVVGILFLALGLLLYFGRQWGDGDAWLLGAFGFLFPFHSVSLVYDPLPVPLVLLFNFFLVSFVYLILYSLLLGIKSKNTSRRFFKELRGDLKSIGSIIIAFAAASIAFAGYLHVNSSVSVEFLIMFMALPVLFAGLIVFIKYGRFIEKTTFKRKIPVSKLRVGDVPVGEKWRVLSEKEVAALKKKGGHIWIKEGVRFSPVFAITLVLTFFFGNLFLIFV